MNAFVDEIEHMNTSDFFHIPSTLGEVI